MAVYLLAFPYHPGLRSPNELSRLMQTRALVDFGEPSLNRAMRVYGPVGDLSYREGSYYPSKAPLLSYAAAPIYAALRLLAGNRIGVVPEIPLVFFSRLFLTVLPTLVTLVFFSGFCRRTSTVTTDLLVVFYALGTLAFSYSLQFLSHQTSASLLFLAFYAAWRWARGESPNRVLVLTGFLAAAAVAAEYTSAMAAGLLALWVPFARRRPRVLASSRSSWWGWAPWSPGAARGVSRSLLRLAAGDRVQAPRRRRLSTLAPGRVPRNPDTGPSRAGAVPLLASPRPVLALAGLARRSRRAPARVASTTEFRELGGSRFHRRATRLVSLLHVELQLRVLGLDHRAPSHDRARAVPAPTRGPGAAAARALSRSDAHGGSSRRPFW